MVTKIWCRFDSPWFLVDVSDIFYFPLLKGGGSSPKSECAGRWGGGRFFLLKNSTKGAGVLREREGRGGERVSAINWEFGGGGKSSFSGPKCPPSPCLYAYFYRKAASCGSKGAFRLPGATWDHFRCTVEPSPGHMRRQSFGVGFFHMVWREFSENCPQISQQFLPANFSHRFFGLLSPGPQAPQS